MRSFSNTRQELVTDYDKGVELWIGGARSTFAAASLHVDALVTFPNMSLATDLQLVSSSEPSFQDAEEEKGLLNYTPLRFEANLNFDSYYPQNQTSSDLWDLLPSRDAAAKVVFRFTMRNSSGHVSTFSTAPWPLVFDEVVRARTPQPQNKCRGEQKGTWRNRRCHVVRRLSEVCMQVDVSQAGVWEPNSKPLPVEENIYKWRDNHNARIANGVNETYGCDPRMAWHPATWTADPCWGTRHSLGKCSQSSTSPHRVSVVVRSAQDPYIRAEELTDDSFDFGFSPVSQCATGAMLLIVGLVLGVVPCLRIHESCKRRAEEAAEVRSIKYPGA